MVSFLLFMNNNPSHDLNLTFLSIEECNNPLIPTLLKTIKNTYHSLKNKKSYFLMSASYGKRVLINQGFLSYDQLKRDSFVEIIDYNVSAHTLLLIGPKKPNEVVLNHWLIHYAKNEISCILEIKNIDLISRLTPLYPCIVIKEKQSMIKKLKTMIQHLQNNNILVINNESVMITASSIPQVNKNIQNLLGSLR